MAAARTRPTLVLFAVLVCAGVQACDRAISGTMATPNSGAPVITLESTGDQSCAVATTGAAYCWGYNAHGQLGNGARSLVNATPVAVLLGGLALRSVSVPTVA